MPNSLSPYALLCASRPKPPATTVTPYDVYSAVASSAAPAPAEPAAPIPAPSGDAPAAQAPAPPAPVRMPMTPARRTHYIADIKTRHNAALRRASLGAPLTPPPSSR